MSEISVTDWQANDIAIYTPKNPNNKTAFIAGRRYIVQDILYCECGCIMLDFGFNFNVLLSENRIKTQCTCDKIYHNSDKIWFRAASFRKQSLSDYIRQRLVEEKFKHEG